MAAVTGALLFSPNPKLHSPAKKPHISIFTPTLSLKPQFSPSPSPSPSLLSTRKHFRLPRCAAVQDIAVEEEKGGQDEEEKEEEEKKRKLYVVNLPWSYSVVDMKNLFGECGTVKDVEVIKQKNGRSRGFAFITMTSGEEARAAIAKFDSIELQGRIIRVEFSKSFRKPSPPPPPGFPVVETRHKIYASNLAWKVRSLNLRNFFSDNFKPLSARVVFDSPTGRSAGYGFVSFATQEEAEAAVAELDGKELLGRPLRLRISEKKDDESGSEAEEAVNDEGQSEPS